MFRTRPISTAVAALLLAVGLAACGSSSSGGSAGSTGSTGSGSSSTTSSKMPTVTIKDFKFSPSNLTVKTGTKVKFVNEDSTTHTATGTGNAKFDSGNLKQGQSYTYTFSKAGTYNYICSIHQYMKGTITVQ